MAGQRRAKRRGGLGEGGTGGEQGHGGGRGQETSAKHDSILFNAAKAAGGGNARGPLLSVTKPVKAPHPAPVPHRVVICRDKAKLRTIFGPSSGGRLLGNVTWPYCAAFAASSPNTVASTHQLPWFPRRLAAARAALSASSNRPKTVAPEPDIRVRRAPVPATAERAGADLGLQRHRRRLKVVPLPGQPVDDRRGRPVGGWCGTVGILGWSAVIGAIDRSGRGRAPGIGEDGMQRRKRRLERQPVADTLRPGGSHRETHGAVRADDPRQLPPADLRRDPVPGLHRPAAAPRPRPTNRRPARRRWADRLSSVTARAGSRAVASPSARRALRIRLSPSPAKRLAERPRHGQRQRSAGATVTTSPTSAKATRLASGW